MVIKARKLIIRATGSNENRLKSYGIHLTVEPFKIFCIFGKNQNQLKSMKSTKYFWAFLPLLLSILFVQPLSAQDQAAKKVNVKKEVKKLLKDLSPEAQMQILQFTKKTRESEVKMMAAKASAEKMQTEKVAEKEVPADQARIQEAVVTKPTPAIVSQPTTPTTPERVQSPVKPSKPQYLLDAENYPNTTVEWYEENHKFDEIKQGDVVSHTFKFKNTGSEPLHLTRVKASCGCTTPKWSQEPVQPGNEGFVEVSFNSAGKLGHQTKTVTLWLNSMPVTKVLRFEVDILPKTAADGQ
jgi:hypothetical protein